MNSLEASIYKTIAFFDIFEYPLTLLELQKLLFVEQNNVQTRHASSLQNFATALSNIPQITNKNGVYFLQGHENYISRRLERYLIAEQKFKKRKNILKLLCLMPHVKMIAICNSLAFSNAKESSDIDLFIITKKNHVWSSRFFSAGLISLLRLRPEKNKTKNTICLSFFTDENNLNFEKLQCLPNDIYLKYWLTQVFPVYDENNYWQKFIQANNWVKNSLPNWQPKQTSEQRQIKLNWLEKNIKKFLELLSFNALYKKIQLKIISPELKELQNKDTRVIINDSMLKLYPLDRRLQYFKEWQQKCLTVNKI